MRTQRETDLEEELDKYRNGYKGACYACEPVGEQNERLQARVTELEAVLRGYVKATTGQESATVTFPMALEGEVK